MKAIRTIVATAVIVFALTTVAMAGVQRFGNGGEDGGRAQAQPVATPDTAAPAGGAVTLSARQFAALLHAVTGDGLRDHTRTAQHERAAARTHKRDKARAHTGTHAATPPSHRTQRTSSSGGGETHHATAQHATTQHTETQHTATQHTETQTHGGGGHGGGGHVGGCD
jgi:hypothetical protein